MSLKFEDDVDINSHVTTSCHKSEKRSLDDSITIYSSATMETSFSDCYSQRDGRMSRVVRGHLSQQMTVYSPVFDPMEWSTPGRSSHVTGDSDESLTDIQHVNEFNLVPAIDDSISKSGIQQLIDAPIISASPISHTTSSNKNNSLPSHSVVRRNIFHPSSSSASCPHAPSQADVQRRPLADCNRMMSAGRYGWRKCVSSSSTRKEAGITMLTRYHTDSTSISAARRLETAIEAGFDDKPTVELIGDFSRPCCLPVVVNGKHQDLKSISCHTMARVLNNEFDDVIGSCRIIDCRYPYEYSGGHIVGAMNCYSKDDILNELILSAVEDHPPTSCGDTKRHIIVFHCEFSSERGPKLLRFLRNKDRELHCDLYPSLRHPEIYLLAGGYREFQTNYSHLCSPAGGYIPMVDRQYTDQLTYYRQVSKLHSDNNERKVSRVSAARGRYLCI